MKKIKKRLKNEFCPICNSNKTNKVNCINYFYLLKCSACGLLFTKQENNISRKDINKQIYSDHYLSRYENRNIKLMNRFKKRVYEIEKIKKGGSVLDFGCSSGIFLDSLCKFSKYSWDCTGIDINKKSINIAKRNKVNATFLVGSINSLKTEKKYDLITCFDVLEHDIELNKTIRKILFLLKPGGLLVVQSPNYKSLMANLCGNNWDWWSVPDHVFHFSFDYLKKYLIKNNFFIINSYTWEPRTDFVINIQGTIKGKNNFILNKIIAKLAYFFLNLLWLLSKLTNSISNRGALSLFYAKK